MNFLFKNLYPTVYGKRIFRNNVPNVISKVFFSNTNSLLKKTWLDHNDLIFPPQGPDEERRPAFVCHETRHIKYWEKKMWLVASFVRGMTVDEALKQLEFVGKKGATVVRETILEAQKKAVEEHNVEFKSNLWVAESFATKGLVIKGVRRHAKQRVGEVRYKYCHYFVRLEEGTPPEHFYYHQKFRTGPELLDNWIKEMRKRRVYNSL